MTSTTTDITESKFYEYDSDCRLFEHDNPRRFARFEVPEGKSFVFSWRSDMIPPSTSVSESGVLTYIGVDERLAAIDSGGRVVFSISLPSLLFAVKSAGNLMVAVCELQAIVFNADGSIKTTIEFPDVAGEFSVGHTHLSVTFMDGGSECYAL